MTNTTHTTQTKIKLKIGSIHCYGSDEFPEMSCHEQLVDSLEQAEEILRNTYGQTAHRHWDPVKGELFVSLDCHY